MKKLLFIGVILLVIASCSETAKEGTKENTIEEEKIGALISQLTIICVAVEPLLTT